MKNLYYLSFAIIIFILSGCASKVDKEYENMMLSTAGNCSPQGINQLINFQKSNPKYADRFGRNETANWIKHCYKENLHYAVNAEQLRSFVESYKGKLYSDPFITEAEKLSTG